MYADSQTIKRSVDDIIMNYCNEKYDYELL